MVAAVGAESLTVRAGETVWVATLSGSRVIVLQHVFRPDDTAQILEVGAAIRWHARALGHAIVAPRSRLAAGSPETTSCSSSASPWLTRPV